MDPRKTYRLGKTCPKCKGHGHLPEKSKYYRVHCNDQGDNYFHNENFKTLAEAKKFVKKNSDTFWGRGVVFEIIAPDGEVVG